MLSEKRFLTRFFLAQLCLIIPIVLVGILAVGVVTNRIEKLEEQTILNRLNNVTTYFTQSWVDYQKESVLLSTRQELLPYKITGDMKDTYEGISLLKSKQYFDNDIIGIFAYYGADHVYSSRGRSGKEVYFRDSLGCREESVFRGLAAMESGEESVVFLFQTDTVGYMMYSYPVYKTKDEYISVNVVFSLEQVKEMFLPADENQWYQLQAADGSGLMVGCDSLGKTYILSSEESMKRIDSGRYLVFEDTIDVMGMTISLYYKEMAFKLDGVLYQMQLISMLLIVMGIAMSAIISWILSKHRMDEIVRLESLARGELDYCFSQNNAYSGLQTIIVSGLNEAKELNKRIFESTSLLRDRSANTIFHGMINNPEKIDEIFRELGFKGCPGCFCVCAVSATMPLSEEQLPSILKKSIWTHFTNETVAGTVFLYELKSNDSNRVQRKKIGEEIRKQLHQQGIRKVRIGMSKAYTESLMIDCAYKQAVSALECVISGKTRDFCGFWENIVHDSYFVLPDDPALEKFSEALLEQDFEQSVKWFHHMLEGYSLKECTTENQFYIRYAILQRLVEYLRSENTVERTLFLKECLNINVMNEKEFKQDIIGILKQCLIKEEEDHFTRMLEYIEKNYSRSDLTYEEVAAAGGVTKTYVSKIFRTKLGVSYIEYLTEVRLNRARILLQTTDYSINDIVKMVGYESASSFRRYFKDKYGIRATDYRKRERQLSGGEEVENSEEDYV